MVVIYKAHITLEGLTPGEQIRQWHIFAAGSLVKYKLKEMSWASNEARHSRRSGLSVVGKADVHYTTHHELRDRRNI